jgi:hypothetical protein
MNCGSNLCRFLVEVILFALLVPVSVALPSTGQVDVSGEMKKWHRVTLTFEGPDSGENAIPNPFLDYRLSVTFINAEKSCTVEGFYAADGNAGETSANAGNKWRVYFVPDRTGLWSYRVSFRTGASVALSPDPNAGSAGLLDGLTGTFQIAPTDKTAPDHRAKGMLRYAGKHYLQFAETGDYFLKAGADSPETFLGYADFDNTYDTGAIKGLNEGADTEFIHKYTPHAADWRPGDPTWKGGKGKNIIGALNYLASKGVNSVYFLTYNVDGGDGKDTWPWTEPNEKLRFDCSKLDQWEIVFSYMDKLGIALHVVTQETENDQGLDGGELGIQRKLYYRELIARFAHHLAIEWNLGEENTNTHQQRLDFAGFIRRHDPYGHPIVVHTFPGQYEMVYKPLLNFEDFEGPSLQMGDVNRAHLETIKWVKASNSGRKWVVCVDEIGPADTGVMPDANDYQHDRPRKYALWGNLMAGGAGCEWYFGYKYPNNDRTCEDFRSRERMWDLTRCAVEFFQKYLPFSEMTPNDRLVSNGWCLAKEGEVYCVYLPQGGGSNIQLSEGRYSVEWFNPRNGGNLTSGSIKEVNGPGEVSIGQPPEEPNNDWVVLVRIKK